jgi:two-component system, NtrC family, sensor kinase
MSEDGSSIVKAPSQAPSSSPKPSTEPAPRPVVHPSIERIIPWGHRIKTKLLALTAVIAAGGVVILAAAEERMREQLFDFEMGGAALFSDTIQHATFRAMLEDRRVDAFEVMRDIGRQEGVEGVRLLSRDGHVAFSTEEDEAGKLLETRDEPCMGCHAAGRPKVRLAPAERKRVFERNGHRVLGFVTPMLNEPRCYSAACHAHRPDENVLGVLDVNLSLAGMDGRVDDFRRGSLALTAVGVLLLSGFFFVFARRNVVRPVQALLEGTRRVAVDQLDTEIRVHSKGELGLLAASFNDMTRSLRRAEGELRDLMQGLEKQVEERTADLQQAQNALVQSEKLSSLGRLSASIAHEINNPLAGILTFAKLVIRLLEGKTFDETVRRELVKHMALVQRETERCSAIVRGLLDFARERPIALRETSINQAVEEALQLISHQITLQGLTLEKRLAPTPPVMADFGQLRQAVVNIGINAIEAMGKSGMLTVTTRPAADGGAEILISDTGPGIPPELLTRVFEPFFTTKEKGTGLGLAVVYGVMQRHGGEVKVKSERGRGATFTLKLPPLGKNALGPGAELT